MTEPGSGGVSGHRGSAAGWIFVATAALCVINTLRPFGYAASMAVEMVLQGSACLAAIGCSVFTARHARGWDRIWRLAIAAAVGCWLVAQAAFWWHLFVRPDSPPSTPLTATLHFGFLTLAVVALIAFNRSSLRTPGADDRSPWTKHAVVILVLDGLVAAIAYAILVWSSRASVDGSLAIARSGGRPDGIAYPLLSLAAVVVAVGLVLAYRSARPGRATFLLLSSGVVTVAAADRVVAYLTGLESGPEQQWARAGFVLGPLLIAFAAVRRERTGSDASASRKLDWAQMSPPYVGTLGIALLYGVQSLLGQPVDAVQIVTGVVLIFMLVARQVVALEDNRQLLETVYAGQRSLVHQVNHDPLTGLPNRLLFADQLDAAVADGARIVLIYLDLDDFKDVNDQHGHAAGDRLLHEVGARLSGCAPGQDVVARIGGDEFAILIRDATGPPEVHADRYRAVLRSPFALHGSSVRVRASMGLVTSDTTLVPATSDELLRRADSSMFEGKRQGKDSIVLYPRSAAAAVDFPTALRRASGARPAGFSVVYQPVVDLADGTPVALEALSRWTAPNGTQVSPETFVAAVEAAGLGADFDAMVLDAVCADIAAAGIDLTVHVNVGAPRLGDVRFERLVADTVARHGIRPDRLVLEVTESVPIVDLARGAAAITRLHASGVRVALDDFGAGYSTLTYLHALPVDIVKLDRSLTVGVAPGRDIELYRSVMGICDGLGIEVIAEGVETEAQAELIRTSGCRLAQGYRFGRPAPMSEVPSPRDQPTTSLNTAG